MLVAYTLVFLKLLLFFYYAFVPGLFLLIYNHILNHLQPLKGKRQDRFFFLMFLLEQQHLSKQDCFAYCDSGCLSLIIRYKQQWPIREARRYRVH